MEPFPGRLYAEVDSYLERGRVDFEALRQQARKADPMFYQKRADARRQMQATQR